MYIQRGNKYLKSLSVRSWCSKVEPKVWRSKLEEHIKCFKTTIDTQLWWFLMQRVHRILATGQFLFLHKIIDLPLCVMCSQEEETVSHLLYGCTKSLSFWKNLQFVIREKSINCRNLELIEKFILFGDLQNVFTDKAFNLKVFGLIVMLAKFCI